ncbi:MAG: nitrogenase component 1 [Methanoculleaceae archaeon]
MGGCTLTGALSVTTQIRDAVTVIHGPDGCAHHNISLLHALGLEQDDLTLPRIVSSHIGEREVIFGGEGALRDAIAVAMDYDPAAVYVLTSCVTGTIGDDAAAVCTSGDWGVPVIHISTAGFLGGTFESGFIHALRILSETIPPADGIEDGSATIIGEKNLEYGVEEHFQEVSRILATLDIDVGLRFVRGIETADLRRLGEGAVNILRDSSLVPLGEELRKRFHTPFVTGFPIGLAGTSAFIREVARWCGCDPGDALREEEARYREIIDEFDDLRNLAVWPGDLPESYPPEAAALIRELAGALSLRITPDGVPIPCPVPPPVGPEGVGRLLHRWRRSVVHV